MLALLKKITFVSGLALLLSVQHVVADEVDPKIAQQILDKLSAARSDLNFSSVKQTPIDGLYQVRVNETQLLYVSKDGGHVIAGDMYQAMPGRLVPVEDLELAELRRELINDISPTDTIAFASQLENGETKAVLYVFTDVDCGYCRKLHNESVPGLTENGVEVRYLAFPRAGVGSSAYRKIASAWCADDTQTAITRLKNGQPVDENVCEGNPVAAQYALGKKMGVTGTPALVLGDGTLVPGYRPAADLLKILGVN